MKNLFLIVLLFMSSKIISQIVDIPDTNFKNALLNHSPIIDLNNDGEIQESEAEIVLFLDISFKEIVSIEGIQSFISLIELECSNNNIKEFDLTQNKNLASLTCNYNNLTEIDISQNLSLTKLICSRNNIGYLDISQNLNLNHLNISHNNISTIDVSQHENLSTFRCTFNNLSELNVTQNVGLKDLSCSVNNLVSLDVSQNVNLLFLFCGGNMIEDLDLSYNSSLYWLQTHSNENLQSLDLRNGGNTGLSLMWAHDTPNLTCILVDNKNFADGKECGYPASGWCKDDDDIFIEDMVDCVFGIEDFNNITFKLFPNPVKNVLTISSENQVDQINIYSVQGILIKQTSSTSIDVSEVSSGVYFAEITIEGKSSIKKFIKN